MGDDTPKRHFIQQIIDADVASGKWGAPGDGSVLATRFPPEPNGFLHVGHAKSICMNHGLAREFGGRFVLRFDDTNPAKEEQRYVDSIVRDVAWLGARWEGASEGDPTAGVKFASDYFGQMHDWAVELIEKGLAYVDEQSADEIRATRGSLKEPGTPSPWRDRPVAENLAEFEAMRRGEHADGSRVLRAKIDMASPNMNLRDPVMYRVVNAPHHRTGDAWHIYPMYDWAHGLEDSIEGITHSICTLEFEDHRPLYDWFIDAINKGRADADKIHHPQQIEFARLNPTYIITSKRKLLQLVEDGRVSGWDDPRMPTVSGLRRRGYTSESVRNFVVGVGVTKFNAMHDLGLLEGALREDLNTRAPRRMGVLDPLKVTITNWGAHGDEERLEDLEAVNNPEDDSAGTRTVRFGKTIWIERDDFMEDPPKKFFRLGPGREVRLRSAFWVTCHDSVKNDAGEVVELRCTYDPDTRGGGNPPPDAHGKVRKVKGTVHWVGDADCVDAEVRLFERLFTAEKPGKATGDPLDDLNPDSLAVVEHAKLERALAEPTPDEPDWPDGIRRFQFERLGYFCEDAEASRAAGRPVFNRAVTLRDSWAKEAKKG
ncbi:MAG: glutamine--tRNA ligase [Phycisphaeraceae bacterium]|nr:MAG: glutamine--tRNA ligase [Phycisphaeraceae bacterium]